MTTILKESSDYIEKKIISTDKEISELKEKIDYSQNQLNEIKTQHDNIDLQLKEANERKKFKKIIWIIAFIAVIALTLISIVISSSIPIALSVFVVLPIAAYFSRFYNDEQNKLRVEKKIADYEQIIRQDNDRLEYLNKKYNDYDKGLIGEKKVTEMLKEFDLDTYLINDITVDKAFGNIDHIIVGPYGIYIIETKNWDGEIICDGDNWSKRYENEDDLFDLDIESISKRVKGNARNLSLLLQSKIFTNVAPLWVQGIIVFTSSNAKISATNPTIPVLTLDELNNYIKSQRMTLFSPRDLDSIANVIFKQCGTT